MADKERLDILLRERDYFPSRSKAKRAIMAGEVYVNDQLVDKAGTKIDKEADIRVKGELHPYVSRGGLKLEKALEIFDLSVQDKILVDIGASTGGFTDCALQNGAQKVYAIDVGYNQLAWKLRSDDRVVCRENTNARYLEADDIAEFGDIGTVDVAFISLTKILPALKKVLQQEAEVITLIKPQFEAGPEQVNNQGVVTDPEIHKQVIQKIIDFSQDIELTPLAISYSPITGGKGHNIEYLAHFTCQQTESDIDWKTEIEQVVSEAHWDLKA